MKLKLSEQTDNNGEYNNTELYEKHNFKRYFVNHLKIYPH